METIPITKAKEGMTLAREIRNEKGIILCQRGTRLSDTMIERLKTMGVETITIATKKSKKEVEKRLNLVKERLSSLGDIEGMNILLEAIEEVLEETAS